MASKPVKGEPPKGSRSLRTSQSVVVLGVTRTEGRKELSNGQYLHMVDIIKQLTGFGRQEYEMTLSIEPFGDFWELKEKGGVLGKKNIRVYFAFEQTTNEIVCLHLCNKQAEGKPHPHLAIKLRNRLRLYRKGELNAGIVRYPRGRAKSAAKK